MQTNLLPAPMKMRMKLRKRAVLWGRGVGALLVVGTVVCVVANMLLRDMDTPLREELQQVMSVMNQLDASEAAAWKQIEKVTHELGVAEDIAGQPKWSIMLGVLAAGLRDGVYLETVTTTLVRDNPLELPPPNNAASGPYRVTLSGVSLFQGDANRYALFLEECRLFDSVRLVATNPRPDVSISAVGFEIACEIGFISKETTP
jgi:hypothetical protein